MEAEYILVCEISYTPVRTLQLKLFVDFLETRTSVVREKMRVSNLLHGLRSIQKTEVWKKTATFVRLKIATAVCEQRLVNVQAGATARKK